MKPRCIWLDCDTGTDDAAAILCAAALPELKLVGLSSVAGNVEGHKTFRNTLRICRLMGRTYPVYAGAAQPLAVPYTPAYGFHGENGLGGVELPLPENCTTPELPAWEAIYRCAAAQKGELELITTGPMTNAAMALLLHPDLPQYLKRILVMGGSATGGNRTPAAEFNVYADPHAAQTVFTSGVPVVMCGLDVTEQATVTPAQLSALAACGGTVAQTLCRLLATRPDHQRGAVMLHDVVPVLYAARPGLFEGRKAWVRVETKGAITRGKTVTDLYSDKKYPEKNALVLLGVDRSGFARLFFRLILSLDGICTDEACLDQIERGALT